VHRVGGVARCHGSQRTLVGLHREPVVELRARPLARRARPP
jgi:hypothetical protein